MTDRAEEVGEGLVQLAKLFRSVATEIEAIGENLRSGGDVEAARLRIIELFTTIDKDSAQIALDALETSSASEPAK